MSSIASETDIDITFSPTTFGSPSSPGGGSVSSGAGVGLSNPRLSQGRRRMLDLVNRLHSTGYVLEFFLEVLK